MRLFHTVSLGTRVHKCQRALLWTSTCARAPIYRRRAAGSSAGLLKELSAGLMVVPGGTISSMRSSTSSVRTTSAAASWVSRTADE